MFNFDALVVAAGFIANMCTKAKAQNAYANRANWASLCVGALRGNFVLYINKLQ